MKKLIALIAAMVMVAGYAYAAGDWDFYGHARVSTFYEDTDVNNVNTKDNDLDMALQGNARIGATVKVSDELSGGFEYGASEGKANIRKLYGEWDFGGGKFLVGQTYTPLNYFYSDQVYAADNDLLAQGGIYSGRQAMLQLTFGGLKIALVDQDTTVIEGDAGAGTISVSETQFPTLEVDYHMVMDAYSFHLGAGFNTYEVKDGANNTYDVDSYLVTVGAKATFGAFSLGGNIYVGENVGNIIAIDVDGDNDWKDGDARIENSTLLDNEAFGFILVANYKVNDMLGFEAGYGYVETELDTAASEDEAYSYYLNATITMAPGVFFVPEVGVIDGDEDTQTDTTYIGAKWQINF